MFCSQARVILHTLNYISTFRQFGSAWLLAFQLHRSLGLVASPMAKRKIEDTMVKEEEEEEIVPANVRRLRIGPVRKNYCYTLISKPSEPGLWKCCKKSDDAPEGQCLFLLHNAERWLAIDAPETFTQVGEVVSQGVPVFMSYAPIFEERDHHWNANWHAHERTIEDREPDWRPIGKFQTVHL